MANGILQDSRKTRYTKKALRDSLIELMKSKSIIRITIKDVCDIADISRSTFYAHYNDQYDLLRQIEEETIVYFEEMLQKIDKNHSKREIVEMVEEMLQYIARNSNSIQVLLSENGNIDFQKKFFRRFTQHQGIMTNFFTGSSEYDPEIREYSLVYVVNGSMALVQHWLKNGMNIPIPDMAKMLTRMSPPPPRRS
ncbi:MAG: TetR/AcrR family transcriptional regulator [Spirochaetaceae bacterium]|jgi:AcrR family transcriptional regulator|nr:TetR/AcrR family transcriptional regulator [Spirochaetaceae bacterium]